MITPRQLIGLPAIVSSSLAPVLLIGGTVVVGALSPGYDPARQTISELAAGDAPTRVVMTALFVLTGLCHLVTATFARGIGIAGRIGVLLGGLATLGVAAFPLPSVAGSSATHTAFAMSGFIALAAWPLLGMRLRPEFPWLVRPVGAVLGTAILTGICLWFLVIWGSHSSPVVGLVERVAADAEALWPAVVATALFRARLRLQSGSTASASVGEAAVPK